MPSPMHLLPRNEPIAEAGMRTVCAVFGVSEPGVRARRNSGREWEARATLCWLLVHEAGLSYGQASAAIGRQHRSSRAAIRRLDEAAGRDARTAELLRRARAAFCGWMSAWAKAA